MQAAQSFDLLGKKHKSRRIIAEEEKWKSATRAYEDQIFKIEGLRRDVNSQVRLTRDLRWKVGNTLGLLEDDGATMSPLLMVYAQAVGLVVSRPLQCLPEDFNLQCTYLKVNVSILI